MTSPSSSGSEKVDIRDLLDTLPTDSHIAGEWIPALSGRTLDVVNPATNDVLAVVADVGVADGMAALDAAVRAQASWRCSSPRERGELLRRAFDLLIERREDFATVMALEMGKPTSDARAEVGYAADYLRWFGEEAVRISGRFGPNPAGTGNMVVSHQAVGPCYLVTPWNFPLAMVARKIAPALAAGCTVVLKPAEATPLTALLFMRLLVDAGVPNGVVNVITTSEPSAVSSAIIADPRLRKVSFTGSTGVGRKLLAQAADGVLRTSMELGGNAPFLVFEDADLDLAVQGAVTAKFRNVGQACTAANRFLIHESVSEEFADRVAERVRSMTIGPGIEDADLGSLVNEAAVTKAQSLIDDAVRNGAELLTGGARLDRTGAFLAPTVLTHVSPASLVLREEIFGPVMPIVTFTDEEEAVTLANDTEYGLVAYVYTTDLGRSLRLVDALETGMMGVNTGVVSDPAAPFGGAKSSGLGREGGREGIDEYLTTKYSLFPR